MDRWGNWLAAVVILAIVTVYGVTLADTEPFFEGDETRHVMTSIFMHDAWRDGGYLHPSEYTQQYFARYPALGLVIWPPAFHAVTGTIMLVAGPTFQTARGVELAYLVLALVYLYRLAARTHGWAVALLAMILFGLGRDVFTHTRAVMLETPLTACMLAAMFHFERYLAEVRRRDVILWACWTIAAGWHRYDAVILALVFTMRVILARKWSWLTRRDVIAALSAIVVSLGPLYVAVTLYIGTTTGELPEDRKSWWAKATFYPGLVWYQLGHLAAIMAAVGLVRSYRRDRWTASAPYWSLLLGVYLFVSPLGEQVSSRHALPWVPALAVFAAESMVAISRSGFRITGIVITTLVAGHAIYWSLATVPPAVQGYRAAAQYTLQHTQGSTVVLFDGLMDGTFIYGMRQEDQHRRAWVIRGDKFLYSVRSDPNVEYIEWAKQPDDVLAALITLDPDWIVVESPPAKYTLPAQTVLRQVLATHPERFQRVQEVPVRVSNLVWIQGRTLQIYRNTQRDPARERTIQIRSLWGGHTQDLILPAEQATP